MENNHEYQRESRELEKKLEREEYNIETSVSKKVGRALGIYAGVFGMALLLQKAYEVITTGSTEMLEFSELERNYSALSSLIGGTGLNWYLK